MDKVETELLDKTLLEVYDLRIENAALEAKVIALSAASNTGSPKLPPCGSCGARDYCLTNAKPDSTQCYDAWRQLRASA
jgi:hypothetical protein